MKTLQLKQELQILGRLIFLNQNAHRRTAYMNKAKFAWSSLQQFSILYDHSLSMNVPNKLLKYAAAAAVSTVEDASQTIHRYLMQYGFFVNVFTVFICNLAQLRSLVLELSGLDSSLPTENAKVQKMTNTEDIGVVIPEDLDALNDVVSKPAHECLSCQISSESIDLFPEGSQSAREQQISHSFDLQRHGPEVWNAPGIQCDRGHSAKTSNQTANTKKRNKQKPKTEVGQNRASSVLVKKYKNL